MMCKAVGDGLDEPERHSNLYAAVLYRSQAIDDSLGMCQGLNKTCNSTR